jgi:outer membrane receptor protein involved in Fe transport
LRLRATTGWTRGFFGAFLGVNYKDSYADNFALLPSGMDSWTTVDLNLRLDGSKLGQGSFFEGATLSLSADNLFDENPPVTLNDNEGIGYDSVNANALGRLISVRLQKRW